MTQKVIHIPTLNDSPHDFARLFGIWKEAGEQKKTESIPIKAFQRPRR